MSTRPIATGQQGEHQPCLLVFCQTSWWFGCFKCPSCAKPLGTSSTQQMPSVHRGDYGLNCSERCSLAGRATRSATVWSHYILAAIRWQIQYKLNTLMRGIITGKCPDYVLVLWPWFNQARLHQVTPGLRSAACLANTHERCRLGRVSSLLADILCTAETQTFKKLLKPHFFGKLVSSFDLHC